MHERVSRGSIDVFASVNSIDNREQIDDSPLRSFEECNSNGNAIGKKSCVKKLSKKKGLQMLEPLLITDGKTSLDPLVDNHQWSRRRRLAFVAK